MTSATRSTTRLATAVAALATTAMAVSSCSHDDHKPKAASHASASPTPVSLPTGQLRSIQTKLTSGRPAQVRDVMSVPTDQRLQASFVRQLAGLTIDFDRETAVSAGPNRVQVHATVTGADKSPRDWIVLLGRSGQSYVVLTTREANK